MTTDSYKTLRDTASKSSRSTIAVIDAMTQRGAFKGEELSTIGQLRDQCVSIIQTAEQIEQEEAMAAPAPAAEEKPADKK